MRLLMEPGHSHAGHGPATGGAGRWAVPAWVGIFILLVTVVQWHIPYPLEDDTAYHYAVARLMRQHGILHSFPWTPFSWQAGHYADKEFLFHLLFMPFVGFGFVTASRIVGVLCGSVILSVLYLILRAERVRTPGLWTLLPLASGAFIYRFSMVRPHLLSIALALVVAWACARGRHRILAVAAFLFPLAYVAFWQIPLMLVAAAEIARRLSGGRFRWQPAVAVVAGIAAGVALHPNAGNLLAINWIHMADILFRGAWGGRGDLDLAQEFNPYQLREWARFLLGGLLLTVAALVVAWRERRRRTVPLAFALAALAFCLLTVKSGRFTEYFIPFAAAAFALATGVAAHRFRAVLVLGIMMLYTLACGMLPLAVMGSVEDRATYVDPIVAADFARQVPAGAQVFTCGWDYTGTFMMHLPDRKFVVAADPTLFSIQDPQLYALWRSLPASVPPDAAEIVRTRFSSRYVICRNEPRFEPFFAALSADHRVAATASERWVLFDLGAPWP
jgi:hypothetical protein